MSCRRLAAGVRLLIACCVLRGHVTVCAECVADSLLPADYDKLQPPKVAGAPVDVAVDLRINRFLEINEGEEVVLRDVHVRA
jgi:hypothetical protein